MTTSRQELVDRLRGDDRPVSTRMRAVVTEILGPRWSFSAGTQNLKAFKSVERQLILRDGSAQARYMNYFDGDGLNEIRGIFSSPRMIVDARETQVAAEEGGVDKGIISITLCPAGAHLGVDIIPTITYADIGSMVRADLALEEGCVTSLRPLDVNSAQVLIGSQSRAGQLA